MKGLFQVGGQASSVTNEIHHRLHQQDVMVEVVRIVQGNTGECLQ